MCVSILVPIQMKLVYVTGSAIHNFLSVFVEVARNALAVVLHCSNLTFAFVQSDLQMWIKAYLTVLNFWLQVQLPEQSFFFWRAVSSKTKTGSHLYRCTLSGQQIRTLEHITMASSEMSNMAAPQWMKPKGHRKEPHLSHTHPPGPSIHPENSQEK